MSAPGKLVRSSRWKTGPSKGQRPLGSECCVAPGDSSHEAYTAIAWGVGLSHERSDIAGAEGFYSLEGNMCGTAMRGADALPGSKATSRAKGSHRKLGGLVSGRQVLREQAVAETVEPRTGTKGNADQQSTYRTQSRVSVSQALERIRKVASERKKERFTALFHHISSELLEEAFFELKEDAAPGVDRLTWKDYEANLGRNLEDLHDRVHRGAYRALPSRRVYIPKPDGRQRPLAVAALEDKIVQRAVAALLNAIYEETLRGGAPPAARARQAGNLQL